MSTAMTAVPATTDQELATLWRVAQAMAASGMYREAFTPKEAFARILAGRDLGLSPSDSMIHVHYLDGRFEPSAEISAALLKAYVGPDAERFDYRTTGDDKECIVTVLRRDAGATEWVEIGTEVYTIADAELAELTGSTFWQKHPKRMLFARAVSNAIDMFAPQVTHPRQSAAVVHADAEPVDLSALPVASDDPLAAVGGRAEDPRGITKSQQQHLARHHEHLASRGQTQRFTAALDAVGAPEDDEIVHRYMSLDENQASELCMRLGKTPAALKENPPANKEA